MAIKNNNISIYNFLVLELYSKILITDIRLYKWVVDIL